MDGGAWWAAVHGVTQSRTQLKRLSSSSSSRREKGFPHSSVGKSPACNAGDPGSIPDSGRSLGEGNGNPLQCSCLENPRDRGAWWAVVYGVTQSRTQLKRLSSSSKKRQGFPGGSAGKESACNAETWVQFLSWEDPLGEGMATHSRILAWRIPWTV